MSAPFTFVLPPELSAKEPTERRGIRQYRARLMFIDRATRKSAHTRFYKIDNYLRPGDLLVFNSSRTLPASMRSCECSESHDAQHPASEEEYFVSATAADKINLP